MKKLKEFISACDTAERKHFAEKMQVSMTRIYHMAVSSGVLPSTAARIEKASTALRRRNKALPELTRGDLAHECRLCPYFKKGGSA